MDDKKILVQIEMPRDLRRLLKERAVKNRRSMRGEALAIIEASIAEGSQAASPEAVTFEATR
jgi:hypothetical protein